MKRMRAIVCGVLAALMLAGCGSGAGMDLTQYAVKEAAYPAYPAAPDYDSYCDRTGTLDWDAYSTALEKYQREMQLLGKGDRPDDGAVRRFADRTVGKIFTGGENTVYSPISLYVALGMLTELTDGETKQQVMDLLGAADAGALRQQIKKLWVSVYQDGDAVCRLANAAFLRAIH